MFTTAAYFKLEHLPFELTRKHGARKETPSRLDCTFSYDPSGYKPFDSFKTKSGLVRFSRLEPNKFRADPDRKADICLMNSQGNLSSLFYEGTHEYCYGNPKEGSDGYLFVCNDDYSEIEVIVLPEQRWLIKDHFSRMLQGDYQQDIEYMRKEADVFYKY